MEECHVLS
jgi:hypothetical protein